MALKITQNKNGTPGVIADNTTAAFYGIGFLHAYFRPLQTALLATAARGELSECLLPVPQALAVDHLAKRYNLVNRAEHELLIMPAEARQQLEAYVTGLLAGFAKHKNGKARELYWLRANTPQPSGANVIASLLMSATVGLAESQERMQQAVIQSFENGGDQNLLKQMFAPHLDHYSHQTQQLKKKSAMEESDAGQNRGKQKSSLGSGVTLGGSNAWAVCGKRSMSGKPILCGDPHLQLDFWPSLLFELRVSLPHDYWLGATIPGLPGIAVGRNKNVAWSGTFGVAANVDQVKDLSKNVEHEKRHVEIKRRFFKSHPKLYTFLESPLGVAEEPCNALLKNTDPLYTRWFGIEKAGEALAAYMALPSVESALEANKILEKAHTLSLHFVLADNSALPKTEIGYCQAGRIPKRREGWSGIWPMKTHSDEGESLAQSLWPSIYEGNTMPREASLTEQEQGIVVSANEGRFAYDGGDLSVFAQPFYRRERIIERLNTMTHHDVLSMQKIQLDLYSLQAKRLLPRLLPFVKYQPLHHALVQWDLCYTKESIGAHAFDLIYKTALRELAPALGGGDYLQRLDNSELKVWWCNALDTLLDSDYFWQSRWACLVAQGINDLNDVPRPWGEMQQVTYRHPLLGGLPYGVSKLMGCSFGPYPLEGSIATVSQGNLVPQNGEEVAAGPVYRMVCDLSEVGIHTMIPGPVNGDLYDTTTNKKGTLWQSRRANDAESDWQHNRYHEVLPPNPLEETLFSAEELRGMR